MEYFETHAHYNDNQFDLDREEVLKKIYESGVTKCINVGYNIESSKKAIQIANKYNYIYATCGIHPSDVSTDVKEIDLQIKEIQNLIDENRKIVAIGEIGLDYHYGKENIENQKLAFIKQIEVANKNSLPIIIHTRDAVDDTIDVIKNKIEVNSNAVLHCCPFNTELVRHGVEQGLYIAFGGTSTFKNSKNAQEIIKMVPNNRILVETDCPYLAPEPVRGTRNDSSNLKYIVQKIAEFKGMEPDNLAKITYNNAMEFFNIK